MTSVFPETPRLGVIGLGYVGLPLAIAFAARFDTVGYDHDPVRIAELRNGTDRTREVSAATLADTPRLTLTADAERLADRDVFIVAVPTPVDAERRPDLTALRAATRLVGTHLRPGGLVIYESTVYPGCTEEVCVPLLEEASGLAFNRDFRCGYSPERANPGDFTRRLATVVKVTSGSTPEAADIVDKLYRSIIPAGTYRAPTIRVAEAAKVIENTQRDLNIALINEIAIILNLLDIDTLEVLKAAETKWNFLPFRPGLVGGHCIGVDPYYLTHRAQQAGYDPEVILAGRRINDTMSGTVVAQTMALLARKGIDPAGKRALVLGLTFKENCPDTRNSRVIDLVAGLSTAGMRVDVHDPWVDQALAERDFGLTMTAFPDHGSYDLVILAVAHHQFTDVGFSARAFGKPTSVVYDVKSVLASHEVDGRL